LILYVALGLDFTKHVGNNDILHIKTEERSFNFVLLLHHCLKLILERKKDDKVTIYIKEEMENVVLFIKILFGCWCSCVIFNIALSVLLYK